MYSDLDRSIMTGLPKFLTARLTHCGGAPSAPDAGIGGHMAGTIESGAGTIYTSQGFPLLDRMSHLYTDRRQIT